VTPSLCSYAPALSRSQTAPELFAQLAAPLHFVDFLREPVVDEETGETLDAHPSFYEAAPGGLPEIRCSNPPGHRSSCSYMVLVLTQRRSTVQRNRF